MLYMYRICGERLSSCPIEMICNETIKEVIWVDLVAPTDSERAFVEKYFKIPGLSLFHEMQDIEFTARFYEDFFGIHFLSLFLSESCKIPATSAAVQFILQEKRFFSIRDRELSEFSTYQSRAKKNIQNQDISPAAHLLALLEIKTELMADELEFIYRELDELNNVLLTENEDKDIFDYLLVWLAKLEVSSNKLRLCLNDSQRALMFLATKKYKFENNILIFDKVDAMLRNIESLIPHNEAVCARIDFLTQTTMGFSEIGQNHTMKLMSMVCVIGLPFMLVNGWLGMNLKAFFGENATSLEFNLFLIFIVCSVTGGFWGIMRRWRWI